MKPDRPRRGRSSDIGTRNGGRTGPSAGGRENGGGTAMGFRLPQKSGLPTAAVTQVNHAIPASYEGLSARFCGSCLRRSSGCPLDAPYSTRVPGRYSLDTGSAEAVNIRNDGALTGHALWWLGVYSARPGSPNWKFRFQY